MVRYLRRRSLYMRDKRYVWTLKNKFTIRRIKWVQRLKREDYNMYHHLTLSLTNITLPFMTNVTISISTSQIFRSWVAIFQPRPPMASLFRSLYGMPGLAPRMDVLSWGRRDFQIGFSNRDTSRNAWNLHWGSFMVHTGILSNNMSFPLTNVKWHSVTWPYTMKTPYWSDFVPN